MDLARGFILTAIAGGSTGLSVLPLKWARHWRWENFWLPYTLISLLLVPEVLAFWLCPNLWNVYAALPAHALLKPFVFGAFWGFAYIGAGICTYRLGFALTGPLVGGVATAFGTLTPLIMQHRQLVFGTSGRLVLLGTGIMLAGVATCGWAGYRREQLTKQQGRGAGFSPIETAMSQAEPTRKNYILMAALAIVSGICGAFMNLALAYGGEIMRGAQDRGAAPQWAPFAVWPVALLGGSLLSLIYTCFLLFRNSTWKNFRRGPREILNPVLAACMWTGGVALYSSATTYLGVLGVSIGFALFFITLILGNELMGLLTGEWHRMRIDIYSTFAIGLTLLFLAIVTLGAANYFSS